MPRTRQIYIPNLKQKSCQPASKVSLLFSSSFRILHIFDHNLRMRTPIQLKLVACKGLIKAHLCINFGWNLIRIYGVMRFMELWSIFFHKKVKDLGLLGKPVEVIGWNLACSNHRRNAFLLFETNPVNTMEISHRIQLVSKLYDDYFNYRPNFSSLLWTVAV